MCETVMLRSPSDISDINLKNISILNRDPEWSNANG